MSTISLRRMALGTFIGAATIFASSAGSMAEEVLLRMEHFLPAQANVPKLILEPWAKAVEQDSDERIKVEIYPAMQLGGTPPELINQVRDGVIDVTWYVIGYKPGLFPSSEVFEQPFIMENAEATSRAFWRLFEKDMKDTEFKDFKILGTWVHGPGIFHSDEPIESVDDLAGMKIRGGSRTINNLLTELGAEPVGLPVPAVSEALSKGVINGTTIPWEVVPAIKVSELVKNHTEFGTPALYTLTFVLAMNKDKYESLPDDLKKVIDDNSGIEFSGFAGRTQAGADGPSREQAVEMGNNIIVLEGDALQGFKDAAEPVVEAWTEDVSSEGIDGKALLEEAKMLIKEENDWLKEGNSSVGPLDDGASDAGAEAKEETAN
ncbi:TRAP transporter substrate-binding protein [Notoacmeibacter sp. MSK16QG-6]|uniref:TRAP transporter substrate-binding protein n=1 Tax=Notoacmeibacter sp. MSK16QG-6 TaxID=2957982 RepID=UPI00209EA6DF|nr:TRAP transporter substrate-binding protein [Notoacmeibacter sp. MSK16QG-6]MCP1198492.1 TRAP transporter substrate-binding protein [Notoacmeibacter sp. MSK16QG-6]